MLLNELKTKIEDGSFKLEELSIKSYLPLIHKSVLCEQVCEDVISYDENGLAFLDPVQQKISITLATLLNYCDLETGELSTGEIIDVIDFLFEKKVYEKIEKAIGDDGGDLYWMIEEAISSVLERSNSIYALLAKGINALVAKMPDEKGIAKIIRLASKELRNLDPDKIQFLGKALQDIQPK